MFKKVTDINDPIITFIQSLRDLDSEVLVDSEKLIHKFIEANRFKPKNLYIKEGLLDGFSHTDLYNEVYVIADDVFNKTSGYKFSKGVLATFEKPQFTSFEMLKPPYVILNGLSSPENVGSVVRTITGLGFKSLIIDSKTCSPYLRRCIRVSMGNINFVDVHRTDDLMNLIKTNELDVYCAANEPGSFSIYDAKPELNSAFMIGSEGHGIDKDILNSGLKIIKIPITEGVLHYNASIACAIIASDWSRKLNLVT